ncbi:hypothetical protein PRU_0941 [Xylanibacter ruminicola 23]|uniref:Uncharacterized protein n=1 Tax=Xylanibacter ruminicola (strain ATCC 19189 / DSM 19721 / CIP 105475 / JCM 8958 / 23) TaxID=264731 RepID=D5ERN0_XYLR2|nr:hypothetical protein PRU_0941 [Xylanibacter ruminicola 23]
MPLYDHSRRLAKGIFNNYNYGYSFINYQTQNK